MVALDPVCMMEIAPDAAEAQLVYEGETFYFCCDECKRILDDVETADVRANLHLICASCRKTSGPPADAAQRKLYASAMRLSPADFSNATRRDADSIDNLSATLKRIIAQAIGRESVAEKPLAVNN